MKEFTNLSQIKHITIDIIPQSQQRPEFKYGDYGHDVTTGTLWIKISEYNDPMYAIFLAIHEIAEATRCIKHGVSLKVIDAFDRKHIAPDVDPGQLPDCPYKKEHRQSMAIEKLLCTQELYQFKEYYNAEPKKI